MTIKVEALLDRSGSVTVPAIFTMFVSEATIFAVATTVTVELPFTGMEATLQVTTREVWEHEPKSDVTEIKVTYGESVFVIATFAAAEGPRFVSVMT